MTTPTGTARLSPCKKFLTITTQAKRGQKHVPNVQVYLVEDSRPDPAVATPAFSLTKGTIVHLSEGHDSFAKSGDVWHVWHNEYGSGCDCPHATFRTNSSACKHIKAMQAVGLLPRENFYEEQPEEDAAT